MDGVSIGRLHHDRNGWFVEELGGFAIVGNIADSNITDVNGFDFRAPLVLESDHAATALTREYDFRNLQPATSKSSIEAKAKL